MSTPLANDTFLHALHRQPIDYTSLWLIRQAGHYLPEYNATRTRVSSFLGLTKSPAYATEVMLQPLDHYPLDATVLFPNILTVPDATGLGLLFTQDEGPRFVRPVRMEADVVALSVPDMSSLQYVSGAVAEIRRALVQDGHQCVPLIGFSGSSWTLACCMVEDSGPDDFRTIKSILYARPNLVHRILEISTQAVIDYLNAQINADTQAMQVFDTWGDALADGICQQFSLAYMTRVMNGICVGANGQHVPVILFTRGGGLWFEVMAETGANALGVDWIVNLQLTRQRTARRVALQGDLGPTVLLAEPEAIHAQVCRVLEDYAARGDSDGHIFNLDHGISQLTPPEAVSVLVGEVHNLSRTPRTKVKSHG